MPAQGGEQSTTTRRRLLSAACEEFARHGFAAARVRDIVDAAGANLAAVNYHFGGKEGLYRATLRHLARRLPRRAPPATNRRGRSPAERLHRQVFALLDRYIGRARPSALGRILAHETMDPTAHLERVVEDLLRPELEELRAVVRDIAGPGAAEEAVLHAALGVIGQCFLHLFAGRALERVYPGVGGTGADGRKALARHIAAFSLPGIERLRREPPQLIEIP